MNIKVWGEFLGITYGNKNFNNHYIATLYKKDDPPWVEIIVSGCGRYQE